VLLGPGKLKELAGYTGGTGVVEGFSSKSGDEEYEEMEDDIPEEAPIDAPTMIQRYRCWDRWCKGRCRCI
jgi:hypothetical protein